jgi:hypothetical protein
MKLNRKAGKLLYRDSGGEQYIPVPARESLSIVWELTKETFSLSGRYDVKSRLQRNVVNIIRGEY